jgi:phosphohistidine swiveling domain-containing protein
VWDPIKQDLLNTYREARESRGLKEWEDIRKLSNADLLSFFLDFTYSINRKEGEAHFIMLMASYYISGLFQKMWLELFGVEPAIDPMFGKVMAGFENQGIAVVRDLWRLGRLAIDLGLHAAFNIKDNREILSELEKSESGLQWLNEYRSFLSENGWRCGRQHAYDIPAWIEDPALAIQEIKMLIPYELFPIEVERERVKTERDEAMQEILAKVPVGHRESFKVLMRAAQKSGYWSEDHTFYCDLYIGALGRWIVTEFGRRFAEAGCIDDPEDVHFLHPNEIRKAAIPMGRINLRHYVEPRKKAWEENLTIEPAPFLGDITQAQAVLKSDPTLSVSTQVPIVREELKADLYGAAAAPGFVEGTARVIMSAENLSEIQPGEILVAPGTSTAWVIAFSLIKGLITDGGGTLSHPVIMARETGIPCIAGCLNATSMIKTGDKVRLDGDRGVVYILSK